MRDHWDCGIADHWASSVVALRIYSERWVCHRRKEISSRDAGSTMETDRPLSQMLQLFTIRLQTGHLSPEDVSGMGAAAIWTCMRNTCAGS